jgi:hypothetical protein
MTGTRLDENLNTRDLNADVQSSSRLRAAAAALAVAGVVAAACPVSGLAAAAKPLTVSYSVVVKPLALAHGTTVKVKATITSPEAKVKGWWSKKSVTTVVRKGVNGGFQSPYSSEGYRCTPKVRGELTSFTCKLQGADVPTTVRLSFAVVYRGDTASG